MIVFLDLFVWWKAGDRTAAILQGTASKIYSKQLVAFLCSTHLAFTPDVSLDLYTVVSTQLLLGRNPLADFQSIGNL